MITLLLIARIVPPVQESALLAIGMVLAKQGQRVAPVDIRLERTTWDLDGKAPFFTRFKDLGHASQICLAVCAGQLAFDPRLISFI